MCTGQAGDGIQQDYYIVTALYQAFCFLQGDGGYFHVFFCRFIKSGSDHFAFDTALHIGHLFRTLIHQYHHQVTLGVIFRNGIGHGFQQHGFTGLRLSHDQSTLSFTNGRKEIHDPGGIIRGSGKEV
mgnify:CR=1 FL=1